MTGRPPPIMPRGSVHATYLAHVLRPVKQLWPAGPTMGQAQTIHILPENLDQSKGVWSRLTCLELLYHSQSYRVLETFLRGPLEIDPELTQLELPWLDVTGTSSGC